MTSPVISPRALVLGLGDSGLAMARFLVSRGFAVRVADTRVDPPRLATLQAEVSEATFIGGEFTAALLDDVQLVALSPGLSPTRSAAAPLVKAALKRKIEMVGEIELFARELARLKTEQGYAPKIIGVTGTNGKTTTTRLAGAMIAAAGKRVEVAGNISPAALDALRARLADADLPEVWVLELSSFQLATTRSLVSDAAAVLNVTEDHLDWHDTMQDYVAAKAKIFEARAVGAKTPGARTAQILNRDDPAVVAMTSRHGNVVTFGRDAPAADNAYGIVVDNGVAWLAWAQALDTSVRRRKGLDPVPAPELLVHRLMPVDALAIRGLHNAMNALAAIALARAIGCPLAPMMHALRRYRGEAHRLQRVATIDGVEYYDDSKGTNVGATVAAVEGLVAAGRKLIVILGGDGKGQDFSPLAAPVSQHTRLAILIGRDAPLIRQALETRVGPKALVDAATLEQAVSIAAKHAQQGDAVLLSPACASFDMFRNYAHRGDTFADAVLELATPELSC
ncbi:MAG: UDP-N-acetylmuramoyl-L-alanine--D-glutamate ligase [Burkholderiaceae bacterium]|nr:UDP-N-acetylmuramoyl-L-alanine--D-glutamate ligase [Burkholderiaceae bacterium]